MTHCMRIATLSVLLLAAAPEAFAHGDREHIMGIVEVRDAARLVVTTEAGTSHSIRVDGATRYQLATGEPGSPSDLLVGDRVVVDVAGTGETVTATTIRFSHPATHSEHEGNDHVGDHADHEGHR